MKTIQFNTKQFLLATMFTLFILGSGFAKGTETGFVSGHENITDTKLTIENWMVNEHHWNKTETQLKFTEEFDANLEMEYWMTNENYWNLQPLTVQEIPEEELEVENWMISERYWK